MGSPAIEAGREPTETQHEVTITNSYYLGAFEVNQDQYEKVMGDNPSHFKGGKNPVDHVYWQEAVYFCKTLSKLPEEKAAGRVYRLPTEAEWEYACRAGSTTAYSFGDNAQRLSEYAWFGDVPGGKTHPVGEKKPNRWGLYDMHGNVSEWCRDWYGPYASFAETNPDSPDLGVARKVPGKDAPGWVPGSAGGRLVDGDGFDFSSWVTDPKGPRDGFTRVLRGGSQQSVAASCRSSSRENRSLVETSDAIGFRVVLIP